MAIFSLRSPRRFAPRDDRGTIGTISALQQPPARGIPRIHPKIKDHRAALRHGLLFEFYDLIGRTTNDSAQLFQCDHGDVLPFFQRIQRFVVDAALQELILRNAVFLHGFPHGPVIKDRIHHPRQIYNLIICRKPAKPYCGYNHNMV